MSRARRHVQRLNEANKAERGVELLPIAARARLAICRLWCVRRRARRREPRRPPLAAPALAAAAAAARCLSE